MARATARYTSLAPSTASDTAPPVFQQLGRPALGGRPQATGGHSEPEPVDVWFKMAIPRRWQLPWESASLLAHLRHMQQVQARRSRRACATFARANLASRRRAAPRSALRTDDVVKRLLRVSVAVACCRFDRGACARERSKRAGSQYRPLKLRAAVAGPHHAACCMLAWAVWCSASKASMWRYTRPSNPASRAFIPNTGEHRTL